MTFDKAMHWIAQGAINIDTGLEKIEKDSYVHKAMHRLCELTTNGQVGVLDPLVCPVCENKPCDVRDLADCPGCHGTGKATN